MTVDVKTALPRTVREIADLIGLDATLKLVDRYGGIGFYCAANPTESHPLSLLVGFAEAHRLATKFRSEYVKVPRCHKLILRARNAEICAEFQAGETAGSLARRHGMTERNIWKILRQSRVQDDPRQRKLFD